MKFTIIALIFSTTAIALPQAPATISNAPKPSAVVPPSPSPKVVGELPKDGLKNLPWQNFEGLASQLGFDPAKATPVASGEKCQSAPNGIFCFGPSGGSFSLGHPGGAFNGETWNPFPGSTGTAGGVLVGSIGSADDVATVSGFVQKLRDVDLSSKQLEGIIDDMQRFVDKLETGVSPKATPNPVR